MDETNNYQKLIEIAKKRMKTSKDPIHDFEHVERVVFYTQKMTKKTNLSEQSQEALILAAWWHDFSRTFFKNVSFVWMPFFDDIISGISLLWNAFKLGCFNPTIRLSIKLIICKSLGTGALFTKILLRKKNRKMVLLLKDADALDVLEVKRIKKILELINDSKIKYYSCKTAGWWLMREKKLYMKTDVAGFYLEEIVKKLVEWLEYEETQNWFVEFFGKKYTKKITKKTNELLDSVILINIQNKFKNNSNDIKIIV